MVNNSYNGYLAPHLDRIRDLHKAGATTRGIAKVLFKSGVRTNSIGFDPLTETEHIRNLQALVRFALKRLGCYRGQKVRGPRLVTQLRLRRWEE
jgi:hypothetical protein